MLRDEIPRSRLLLSLLLYFVKLKLNYNPSNVYRTLQYILETLFGPHRPRLVIGLLMAANCWFQCCFHTRARAWQLSMDIVITGHTLTLAQLGTGFWWWRGLMMEEHCLKQLSFYCQATLALNWTRTGTRGLGVKWDRREWE